MQTIMKNMKPDNSFSLCSEKIKPPAGNGRKKGSREKGSDGDLWATKENLYRVRPENPIIMKLPK